MISKIFDFLKNFRKFSIFKNLEKIFQKSSLTLRILKKMMIFFRDRGETLLRFEWHYLEVT